MELSRLVLVASAVLFYLSVRPLVRSPIVKLTNLECTQSSVSAGILDSSSSIFFCKCICFSNYTILPLYRPQDPSKPCLSCTRFAHLVPGTTHAQCTRLRTWILFRRQFCLDQQLKICKDASKGDPDLDTGMGQEGDVQTKCFRTVANSPSWDSFHSC
jgi:hypothetical protein